MPVRARLYVTAVTKIGSPNHQRTDGVVTAERVSFQAVYSADKSTPNYSYSQATPQASAELLITNPGAWGAFLPGHTYDVTFEPAAQAVAPAGDGVAGE